MTVNKIPLAGVIGNPITHSLSPKLHGHWLKTYGITGHYIPMHVENDDLETVLRSLHKAGFKGCNITLPHKENALKIADHVSERAKLIGAANTLTYSENGEILADNTDGYGFYQNLIRTAENWVPNQTNALVLGAGGAARAVLSALIEAGVTEIYIVNRTKERAENLQAIFGPRIKVADWQDIGDLIPMVKVIVNTTSLGMVSKQPLDIPLSGLNEQHLVTDIVYTPLQTDLLKAAQNAGSAAVDGLGMLLYQAVPGFEKWFGIRPEVTESLRQIVLAK